MEDWALEFPALFWNLDLDFGAILSEYYKQLDIKLTDTVNNILLEDL